MFMDHQQQQRHVQKQGNTHDSSVPSAVANTAPAPMQHFTALLSAHVVAVHAGGCCTLQGIPKAGKQV
jgi:hypothetical protein